VDWTFIPLNEKTPEHTGRGQKTNERRYRVPRSKFDMVREHLSKRDPGDTEENSHHRANDVSSELANPDLCYF
jgi:hypothetical protein